MISSSTTTPVPQHILQRRAAELSRRIHRSLPWGFRLAGLLSVLAADAASTLGRVAYALFIAAAVRGMPAVQGKDALDLVPDIRGPEDANKLPSDYGRVFGNRLYRVLLARFDAEVAEEALADTMLKIARGRVHVRNGASLAEAEALVVTIALNSGRDLVRRTLRRREVSDHDEERTIDIEDPEAFRELSMTPGQIERTLQDLERVHPRARPFVEALLEGDSQSDVADAWRVSPSYVSKWLRQYGPRIKKVVEHHLRAASVGRSCCCGLPLGATAAQRDRAFPSCRS